VLLPGFTRRRIQAGEVTLQVAVGGQGPPVVLLHGYPQTHACWHAVAPKLAGDFTVVCPDLRGYGDSDKPEGDPDHQRYAKRAMAADIHRLMTGPRPWTAGSRSAAGTCCCWPSRPTSPSG
jgi:haloacetate dehalogenase